MRKAYKILISLSVILIAGLNLIVPAFAQDPFSAIAIGGIGGASGAGLFSSMAGMSGINVGWSNTGSDPLDAMWNVLNPDHVYFSGEKHEADPQSDPEDLYDYIKVDIGDWLQAQSDFIVNFAQTNNVQDNSSGNVSVPPSYHGYYFSTQISDTALIGAQLGTVNNGTQIVIGAMRLNCTVEPNLIRITGTNADGTTFSGNYGLSLIGSPIYLSCAINNINRLKFKYYNGQGYYDFGTYTTGSGTVATSVPWSSGTVNTNVFNGWESAKVKIPKSISQLQSGWTVPDFLEELNRLWENSQQVNIVIEDGDEPDPPVPPPPVPSTPLGDTAFNDFVDLWGSAITDNQETANDKLDFIGSNGEDQLEEIQDIDHKLDYTNSYLEDIAGDTAHISAGTDYILQDLDNIDTNVGDIEDSVGNIDTNVGDMVSDLDNIDTNITSIEGIVGSIDTNVDDLADTAESIDTNIGIGNGILGGIRSLAQSAVNYLEGIAEHVGELVEEIVEGTETLIAGILNQIPQAFGVIFGPIKQASSIWHYVVEWVTSIGAPFQFIWSMASGTSYYVILPVYASLAAAVVLAFFKRFGR